MNRKGSEDGEGGQDSSVILRWSEGKGEGLNSGNDTTGTLCDRGPDQVRGRCTRSDAHDDEAKVSYDDGDNGKI